MDPDATLAEIRELIGDADNNSPENDARAIELFEALDEHLSRGGYQPEDWRTDPGDF